MLTKKLAAETPMTDTIWASKELAGWGRLPVVRSLCTRLERRSDAFEALAERDEQSLVAHGLGRSYGDAALLDEGRVILTRRLDRMLEFDESTGWLHCEAGVSIGDLIDVFLPRGWFPPVVPGTQFVTIGGAIGCNIHGKNHGHAGCFGDHIRQIELLCADGQIVTCGPEENPDLFWATVGGMGLTGLILSAQIQLYPVESGAIEMETIRFDSLDEFFAISADSTDYYHTVSWIDCLRSGSTMGRGVFMRGRHAPSGADDELSPGLVGRLSNLAQSLVDGRALQSNHLLNKATIRLFNEAYFHSHPAGVHRSTVACEPFFFPLDAVANWNHIYGDRGFLQYQVVVPEKQAMAHILELIAHSGMASFLAVIKEFGDADHGGLSFPCAGTTLALDFPNYGPQLFDLLDRLDEIVVDVGGRVYLGKDARLSAENFRRMYPQWQRWKSVRDQWDPDGVFQSDLSRRLQLT